MQKNQGRKMSKEEAKLKKKEYDKKRREQMKENPQKLEELRQKERLKYIKKKEKGQVKPAAKMNSREHRLKKKKWKTNSKKYRDNRKKQRTVNNLLATNTPPDTPSDSDAENPRPHKEDTPSTSRKEMGRKRIRRDRSKMYKKIKQLEIQLKIATARAEKYKKRLQRQNKNKEKITPRTTHINSASPNTKVNMLLGKTKVSPSVRKKILLGEVIQQELKHNYETLGKSHEKKQNYYKILNGRILKKYRFICSSETKSFFKYKSYKANEKRSSLKITKIPRGKFVTSKVKQDVMLFLDNDDNTRMCPGKKDCLSAKSQNKQIRLLNDSLLNLHKKFLSTVSYKISYSTFCRLKPKWIKWFNVNDRNTCKCMTHANFEMLVCKLHEAKIFKCATQRDVLSCLCCDTYNTTCLFRKCSICKNKRIEYILQNKNAKIKRKIWTYETSHLNINGKQKILRKPIKQECTVSVEDLVLEFEESIPKYITHVGNIVAQHQAISYLKSSLSNRTVLIHVDFSENYSCKYAEEIQSVHFGGARQQITLHTGVIYMKSNETITPHSFCTLSECNRHDPAAIWTYLRPIFNWALQECPDLRDVHILSDGPVTQYRNKIMFHIISHHIEQFFPNILNFTWNYSEAGHGKGAPDGIGGTLKRSADRAVAQGKDFENFSQLVSVLKKKCPGIRLITVTLNDINQFDSEIRDCKPQVFKGTLGIHQVVYNKYMASLDLRSLSCFECASVQCIHYSIGQGYQRPDGICTKKDKRTELPLSPCISQSQKKNNLEETNYVVNDWVMVEFEGELYPGKFLKIKPDSITVNAMEPIGEGKYKWPRRKDILDYSISQIKKKISLPVPTGKNYAQFNFQDLTELN